MCEHCEEIHQPAQSLAAGRRLKLWELKPQYHCSILGTCLTMDELRKVIRQSGVILKDRPSDYELHAAMVGQAEVKGRPARNLQKMLDNKYRRWIQALAKCKEPEVLTKHWQQALGNGDVAGTFWAIMTHPQAHAELIKRAYEDVHMLSHIQGAANRADLKRLKSLEAQLAELQETLTRTRYNQQQQIDARDRQIQSQKQDLIALTQQSSQPENDEREALEVLRRQNQILVRRLEWTESQLAQRDIKLDRLEDERLGLKELLSESMQAQETLEQTIGRLLAAQEQSSQPQRTAIDLCGKRILYVGGQTTLAPHLRSLVEAHNGRFEHHDGGVEESRAGLQCALAGADMVFCPVDCISHDACRRAKLHCRQQNKQFIPLRSSGVSAFAASLHHCNRFGNLPDPDLNPGTQSSI